MVSGTRYGGFGTSSAGRETGVQCGAVRQLFDLYEPNGICRLRSPAGQPAEDHERQSVDRRLHGHQTGVILCPQYGSAPRAGGVQSGSDRRRKFHGRSFWNFFRRGNNHPYVRRGQICNAQSAGVLQYCPVAQTQRVRRTSERAAGGRPNEFRNRCLLSHRRSAGTHQSGYRI